MISKIITNKYINIPKVVIIINYYKKMEAMLYNYKATKAEIKNIIIEMEELKNDYTGCGSITYEEKSSPTNKFNSSVENEAISKQHEVEYLERQLHRKESQIQKIDNALETLMPNELKLIKLRYFEKLNFQEIGQRINLNDNYCIQLKSKIIQRLIDMIFVLDYAKQ